GKNSEKTGKKDVDGREKAGEDDERCAVRVLKINKSFGDNHVLKDATFYVPQDKITVLIGGSGSGKSVMMKHILGLFQPDSGAVEVFGQKLGDLRERELRELRTQIGMLFQHAAL